MPASLQRPLAFGPRTIDADTSDYYLKALRGDGYGFVANNANTHVELCRRSALPSA